MQKKIEIKITEKENGLVLRTVLSKCGLTRHEISRLKFSGGIFVNDEAAKVNHRMKRGDVVTLLFHETASIRLGCPDIRPDILYEDEDLIIVNKPAGMPCHPSHHHIGDDMGTLLQTYYQEENFTIRAIGRLDKDVSGVMCYAKNQPSAARLSRERSGDVLHKTYLAIAEGSFEKKKGTLEYRLAKEEGRKDRVISEKGKLCITDYEVIREADGNSLLLISICTGRTHQIRAGMAVAGHPLLGDALYGGRTDQIARPALHCFSITLKQPFTGEEIKMEAPLPEDMKKITG